MNGGVLHAVEGHSYEELVAAQQGYRFYSFHQVAKLLARAKDILEANVDLDAFERVLDTKYREHIQVDEVLAHRFECHYRSNPQDFSPLNIH